MHAPSRYSVIIDDAEDSYAIKRRRDNKIVATELDVDTAEILCSAYNDRTSTVVFLEDVERSLSPDL